jgi:protein gp37
MERFEDVAANVSSSVFGFDQNMALEAANLVQVHAFLGQSLGRSINRELEPKWHAAFRLCKKQHAAFFFFPLKGINKVQ